MIICDDIPYIDPNVKHVAVSKLRRLGAKDFATSMVIHQQHEPLAVILPYSQFQLMQDALFELRAIEALGGMDKLTALRSSLRFQEQEARIAS